MNQLPIVILSKQLKYSLATDKVKTLEKAIELIPKLTQAEEGKKKAIEALAKKYNAFKLQIASQFDKINNRKAGQLEKRESTQQIPRFQMKGIDQFYHFIMSSCICEIYGPKGSGKTSLLLHFAQQFAKGHKGVKKARVLILNCVTGITLKRLECLRGLKEEGMNIECLQIGQPQQIIKQLTKLADQQKQGSFPVFVGIDMMALLLISRDKPKIFISRLFNIIYDVFKQYQWTCMFTNLIQHKYELGNEQVYNHASYYCQSTAQYLMYKLYLERPDKNSGRYKFVNMKGKKMEGYFSIEDTGVKDLKTVNSKE